MTVRALPHSDRARFVGECGGFGNIAALRAGIRAVAMRHGYVVPAETQVYQTAEAYAAVLAAAGFSDIDTKIVPRQTPLPTGITGWLKTFRSGFLDTIGVPHAEQPQFATEVEDFLRPLLCTPAGDWIADYVRLRFSARKPE